jgi:predicted metalloprotease
MRWERERRSDNVEDRRGNGFPGGRGMAIGGGLGGIVLLLLAVALGLDPGVLMQGNPTGGLTAPAPSPGPSAGREDEIKQFVSAVLGSTEDTWSEAFRRSGRSYEPPTLVLFTGRVQSACGGASAAAGPFYCPLDRKLYLDPSFFSVLQDRLGASGDFAQAYVIAHEVGHHVQTLLGISEKVQAARRRSGEAQGNALSVRLELQADCLAGVWANHAHRARQILQQGDVEEGLTAAAAIGDDRLQRGSHGHVTPEAFTHGSAAQRVRWLKQGLGTGEIKRCDTFGGERL